MNGLRGQPPHRLVLEQPLFHAAVAVASLLLSLWAIWLDPVINSDGVNDVRAAQYFRDAEWRAGIEMAGEPVYALAAAAVSLVTGMSEAYGLYALNAGLFALLTVGFVVLASVLGGGRPVRLWGALLVLLFPALNGFRSFIASDIGYWAFYVWALAYILHYAVDRDRPSAKAAALAGIGALLFALEALLFLVLVPLWLVVHNRDGGRLLKLLVIAAGGGLLLGYALWDEQWHAHVPVGQLLLHPVEHMTDGWHELSRALAFKLEALQGQFLDRFSEGYQGAALLASLLVVCVAGLLETLGLLHTALAGWALVSSRWLPDAAQRYWWGVFAVIGVLALLVPALVEFDVGARDAMVPALTALVIVPAALQRLWRGRGESGRWLAPLIMVLVVVVGVRGLDLRSERLHLREAGLWLRANAPANASFYSNSRVVVYYSGLYGYRPWADYSWQEAMTMVWQSRWPNFHYLALVVAAGDPHREGILMRKLDLEPVQVFTGDTGGKVLIFDTRQ